MANLDASQKLTRVLPGLPFGTGAAGDVTLSSDTNSRATILGTAGSLNSTLGSNILSDGDVAFIIQTQGAGAGQYEVNRVASGGSTTSIVWQTALKNTYVAGAQVIKITLYNNATINAHAVTPWDGTIGGIEVIVARKTITVAGAVNAKSVGFRFGGSRDGFSQPASYATVGENYGGTKPSQRASLNGAGGAGGTSDAGSHGGGGSGYGTDGTDGQGGSDFGLKGVAFGNADLTTLHLGPGGGGFSYNSQVPVDGSKGGGILVLISSSITMSSGSIDVGSSNVGGAEVSGGVGAAGSAILICRVATLGSALITAKGGTNTATAVKGGNGGDGRIAVHHAGAITGTTNPTFTDVTDSSLIESSGALIMGVL